jgi:2-oxoglutarate ferredoxin oxidoreductase subunit beta
MNGSPEEPFNFCHLASSCGATYVARWTAMQVRSLRSSITEALQKTGFSFVEVITPCPSSFGRRNRMGSALEMLKFYHGRSVIRGDIDPKDATMDIDKEIIVGKFVDIERPTFLDNYAKVNRLKIPQWRSMYTEKAR